MAALVISGSSNVTSLDSKIVADLCGGNFLVDVTPSIFSAAGISTVGGVQGASVRITNPVGVIFKQYPTSGFDIYPPMTSIVSVAIPLIAANYQYGTYTIDVRLTDEDGTQYTVTKTVNICPPDSNNKTKKTGCLDATIAGNCKDGKVVVTLDQPPTYKGTIATSQVNALKLEYPTKSALPVLSTTFGSFSVVLFEGVYLLTGTACVLYTYTDNVYFKVQYKVNCNKPIKCIIDECCVFAKLEELNLKLKTDCTAEEKANTSLIALDAIRLLKMAQLAADCGEDPSDIVAELEDLLGCQCTCNCNEGTPIINNAPVTDFVFTGCGFSENTVGLTKTITLYNYGYKTVLAPGSSAGITLSAPVLDADNCQYIQTLNYTAPAAPVIPTAIVTFKYRGIITQTSTGVPTATIDSTNNTVTIAFTRLGVGSYLGTVSGLFTPLTVNNLFILFGKTANILMKANWVSANSFSFISGDPITAVAADSLIDHVPLELSIIS